MDAAEFETIKKKGKRGIRKWIDTQLQGTSVTVVLVGEHTCTSEWVEHEIEKSKEKDNGLLGIDISEMRDPNGETSSRCGKIPEGYSFYSWTRDDGYVNMGDWIGKAAREADRSFKAAPVNQFSDSFHNPSG